MKNLNWGLNDIGPRKFCRDIIRENFKEYKGLIKATEQLESPNKKLKDLLPGPSTKK